jgi:hypothetical protein
MINPMGLPKLKTKKFSEHHIELFRLVLLKINNREINWLVGYSKVSHCVVDHTRKVMYKLLALEGLAKKDHELQVVYPRDYCFWWHKLLEKHEAALSGMAVKPEYYGENLLLS